jgi:hypothetical protein
MIIGTFLGSSLGCGCAFGADAAPAVAPPIATPAKHRGKGARLVSPYDLMRSGGTPRWNGKDPRYMLTNVSALLAREIHP